MDKINIKNLEIFAKHGVYPAENTLGQKFVVSCTLYTDLRSAGKSDELEKSVDYGRICLDIKNYVEKYVFKLIETVAENLALKLLSENEILQKVWIEIKKPWAPVAMHLETVSVEIERERHRVYLSIGSNMGDRSSNLYFAVSELGKAQGCRVLHVSQTINTAPYGDIPQNDFLNACVLLETFLSPHELLDVLHRIENDAGRERSVRWGPRTLDIDIVFFDDIVISDEVLTIPHIEAHKRGFVLEPLNEIAPFYRHPLLHKTVNELYMDLTLYESK